MSTEEPLERDFAAGGVVLRDEEVAVIVPVKRAVDGSRVLGLPKGHPDDDETPEQAAIREVMEETGLRVELRQPLGEISYRYQRRSGAWVDKRVAFYLFHYLSGDLADHDHEIEDARWMPLDQAVAALTYDGEREMVRRAMSRSSQDL
jgi:8-oxo-dGTP pyrophosphatase MutT (NUDIX family)